MHKKRNIIIACVSVFVVLIGLLIYSQVFLSDPISRQYPNSNLESNHVFEEVSLDKLMDLIKSGDRIIVLVSNPSCTVCVNSISDINKYAKENNIKKIYYLRAYQNDSHDKISYDSVLDFMNKYSIDDKQIRLDVMPQILAFENNVAINYDSNYESNQFVERAKMILKELAVVE